MASYYYLMAQLPYLNFDQKPPMSSEAFKEMAKNLLNKNDAELLDNLKLYDSTITPQEDKKTGCRFIDLYYEWEKTLRLNAAKFRATHLKRENSLQFEPSVVPHDAVIASSKAVNSDCNPLEGEILIDKARWNYIDEIAGTDYFTRNHVFAYLLKLLLLERRFAQETEKGFLEYKSLYEKIIEDSNSLGEIQ